MVLWASEPSSREELNVILGGLILLPWKLDTIMCWSGFRAMQKLCAMNRDWNEI